MADRAVGRHLQGNLYGKLDTHGDGQGGGQEGVEGRGAQISDLAAFSVDNFVGIVRACSDWKAFAMPWSGFSRHRLIQLVFIKQWLASEMPGGG
ncbi:hypothetical protein D3C86_1928370 [compost metagenome]